MIARKDSCAHCGSPIAIGEARQPWWADNQDPERFHRECLDWIYQDLRDGQSQAIRAQERGLTSPFRRGRPPLRLVRRDRCEGCGCRGTSGRLCEGCAKDLERGLEIMDEMSRRGADQ
jgi:hypothetical protein